MPVTRPVDDQFKFLLEVADLLLVETPHITILIDQRRDTVNRLLTYRLIRLIVINQEIVVPVCKRIKLVLPRVERITVSADDGRILPHTLQYY
jgi:hypothetical protein